MCSFHLNDPSRHLLSVPSPGLGAGDLNGPHLAPGLRRGEGVGTWASSCRGGIPAQKGSQCSFRTRGCGVGEGDILEEVEPDWRPTWALTLAKSSEKGRREQRLPRTLRWLALRGGRQPPLCGPGSPGASRCTTHKTFYGAFYPQNSDSLRSDPA